MPGQHDVLLPTLRLFSTGDQELLTHQIEAGDHLGDGVLDLQAGIDFEEVVVVSAVHQELDGAGVGIAYCFCANDRGLP